MLYENINIIRKYFSSDEMCIEGFVRGLQLSKLEEVQSAYHPYSCIEGNYSAVISR